MAYPPERIPTTKFSLGARSTKRENGICNADFVIRKSMVAVPTISIVGPVMLWEMNTATNGPTNANIEAKNNSIPIKTRTMRLIAVR